MRPEVCTPFHSLLISLQKVKRLGAGTGSSLGFIHHPEQILCYFQLFSLGKSRATGWVGSGTWRGHGTTSKRITWPKDRTWTQFSSVTQSCPTLCDPHGLQHARLPCPSPTPGVYSNSYTLSWWCHSTFSSSVIPFSSHLQSFPESGSFQWVSSSHQVAKVLEFQLQHQSFQWIFRTDFPQDWLVKSPCSPRDSQESSPTPQFKSIHSSTLSFLSSPTLTSIYDYWKNHSFD